MIVFRIPVVVAPLFSDSQTGVLDDIFCRTRATRDRRPIQALMFHLCLVRSHRGTECMLLPRISLELEAEPDGRAGPDNMQPATEHHVGRSYDLEVAISQVRSELALLLTDSAFQRRAASTITRIRNESPTGMRIAAIEHWALQVHRDFALVHHEQPFYKCVTDAADAGWDLDRDYYNAQFGEGSARAARAAVLTAADWRADSHQQRLAVRGAAKIAYNMLSLDNVAVAQTRDYLFLPDFSFQVELSDTFSRSDPAGILDLGASEFPNSVSPPAETVGH